MYLCVFVGMHSNIGKKIIYLAAYLCLCLHKKCDIRFYKNKYISIYIIHTVFI